MDNAAYSPTEPPVPRHWTPRKAFLCFATVLVALAFADAIRFAVGDFAVLRAETADAVAALAGLDAASEVHAVAAAELAEARRGERRGWARFGAIAIAGLVTLWFVFDMTRPERQGASRETVVRSATYLLLIVGTSVLGGRLLLQESLPGAAAAGIFDLVVLHALAGLLIPWRARESILAGAPLLVLWGIIFLALPTGADFEGLTKVVLVLMSPIALAPGAGFAGWRTRVREDAAERQALGAQVESFGGELHRARIVHDAMFPDPIAEGPVAFDYAYEPIHEIGGDYVHVDECPETGRLLVTLLDVAGHGLAAALTVNRLFGEIERILAEDRSADPSTIMTLLNRYIHLTMARHGLFATGCCICMCPIEGTLTWVNAGHPPAFVRRGDGAVEELRTTAMLLGVLPSDQWTPDAETIGVTPGDVVVAYTDGAFEARDREGRKLGIPAIRELLGFQPPPRSWPRFIASAVAEHHAGVAEDDVLIASVTMKSRRVG